MRRHTYRDFGPVPVITDARRSESEWAVRFFGWLGVVVLAGVLLGVGYAVASGWLVIGAMVALAFGAMNLYFTVEDDHMDHDPHNN